MSAKLQKMWRYLLILPVIILAGCISKQRKEVDLLLFNGRIYTVDSNFSVVEAIAIHEGRIVETGSTSRLIQKYHPREIRDLHKQTVLPGFIDAHSHFIGFSRNLAEVDLRDAPSESTMYTRVQEFAAENPASFILGRGWDQNLWDEKKFPTRHVLDSVYPNTPVVLTRIDGHACLVNGKVLEMAGITPSTQASGGEIVKEDGWITGVLIDGAMDLLDSIWKFVPRTNDSIYVKKTEQLLYAEGLTSVSDAGLPYESLQDLLRWGKSGWLSMGVYAMANPSDRNIAWLTAQGIQRAEDIHIGSVKLYADGAMGSRGACLHKPYSDDSTNNGFLILPVSRLDSLIALLAQTEIQVNTHCIGDSALDVILRLYARYLEPGNDRRWRIEHAQLVSPSTLPFWKKWGIIPSMQPTHATSDAEWVDERLGEQRLTRAYNLKRLLNQNNWLPLGTDFPVEYTNPLFTLYTAVFRKNPQTGYTAPWLRAEALSHEEAIRGMTIWAAKAQFEEAEKGSLEAGKWADLVIWDTDLTEAGETNLLQARVVSVYKRGKIVYEK